MNEHSEISADSRIASTDAAGEQSAKLRLALVPSFVSSGQKSHELRQLGRVLSQEGDFGVLHGASQSSAVFSREIDLWASGQRAQVIVVQVGGLADLALRWLPSLVISRLHGKRIVGLVDFASLQFQKPVVRQLIRKLLAKADALVTSTEWQAGGLRRIGLTAKVIAPVQEKIAATVIDKVQPHLCVAIEKDQLGEADRILQSFALVKQKYPRAEITVVAARQLHSEIYDRAANAGMAISQSIHIVDQCATSSSAPGDVVISFDRDTDFPRQLVSAWNSGRPVLVPAFSLVSSVVRDYFNGLVYSTVTVAGLADAVIRLVEHPELVQQLSSQGLTEARSYQWEPLRVRWRTILITKK